MNEHLDDDAISASLDGEPQPHLDGCPECRARADQLRAAAAAIGAVPPVDARRREAAIAAAVRSAGRRRPPAWVAGVAAAAVLALVLIPLVGRGGHHDQSATTSAAAPKAAQEHDLATDARAATPSTAASAGAAAAGVPCEPELRRRDPSLQQLLEHRAVVLDGRPAVLVVFTTAGGRRTYTVDTTTCSDVRPPVDEGGAAPQP